MKLKKWLSRALVLAMVVALMVPMPVAAKSSKSGGKLVKSVEYYDYNNGKDGKYGTADDKYVPTEKAVYTFDKKNNPSEVKTYHYSSYFLNTPVDGWLTVDSYKYKYKGKTPKSMKAMNNIGYVVASRKYSKGKVVSFSSVDELYTAPNAAGVEAENSEKSSGSVSYNKAGNITASCSVSSRISAGAPAGTDEYNEVYYVVQKKGIPSYIYVSAGNHKETAADGKVTFRDYSADGGEYATCNGKGLVVQTGYYDKKANKYNAELMVQYVMKKGNVSEAIVFSVGEDGKQEAVGKYVFKYGKKKISKQRYMNMINDLTLGDFGTAFADYFFWY